jgi:hypothetical protein
MNFGMQHPRAPWLKRLGFIFLPLVVAVLVAQYVIGPFAIRRWVTSQVSSGCDSCQLRLARVRISLFPFTLSTDSTEFHFGDPASLAIVAKAQGIAIPIQWRPLFQGHFRVGDLELEKPEVHITEGDAKLPQSDPQRKSGDSDFEVAKVVITHGVFTYAHHHHQKTGRIHVSHIDATVESFGNSERLKFHKTEGNASGILEQTGKFRLKVVAPLFAKETQVSVTLRITGLNLDNLNKYFQPNDGVSLAGNLLEGQSSVDVKGRYLAATAFARFEHFGVQIEKSEERNETSAALQTFLASLKLGKQNVDGQPYSRTGKANLLKKPEQSLISFILKGMQQAAMEVSAKAGK